MNFSTPKTATSPVVGTTELALINCTYQWNLRNEVYHNLVN